MRDSMIFYRSFFEAITELPDKNKLQVYDAMFEFGLNFKEPELNGISKTIFTLIRPQLEANIKRFENGNKPKRSKTEANNKQTISKTEANNNDNVNENNNVNNNINKNTDLIDFLNQFHNDEWFEQIAMKKSISLNKIQTLAKEFEDKRELDKAYNDKSITELRTWFVNYIDSDKTKNPIEPKPVRVKTHCWIEGFTEVTGTIEQYNEVLKTRPNANARNLKAL